MPIKTGIDPGYYDLLKLWVQQGGQAQQGSGSVAMSPDPNLVVLVVDKWRCTHGHKWEGKMGEWQVTARNIVDGQVVDRNYCARCVIEFFDKHLGQIRENK